MKLNLKKNKSYLFIIVLLLLSCNIKKEQAEDNKPYVFVSILPQKYFVDKITNNIIKCYVMVPQGANPHTFEPQPSQLKNLSKTKIYFSIGLEFENSWLPKFSSIAPSLKIIRTDTLISKRQIESSFIEETHNQKSIHENEHIHSGYDPHIWLSPRLAKIQINTIAREIINMDPKNKNIYENNLRFFLKQIDTLEEKISSILKCKKEMQNKEKYFLVFHPSFGYFADDFCLKQLYIEMEGKEPQPRFLKNLIDISKTYKIKTVFIQPQFSSKTAEVVAKQIKAELFVIDPFAYEWDKNLIYLAERLANDYK
jgi:zinc transport system substrate-binding protein